MALCQNAQSDPYLQQRVGVSFFMKKQPALADRLSGGEDRNLGFARSRSLRSQEESGNSLLSHYVPGSNLEQSLIRILNNKNTASIR